MRIGQSPFVHASTDKDKNRKRFERRALKRCERARKDNGAATGQANQRTYASEIKTLNYVYTSLHLYDVGGCFAHEDDVESD